MKLLEDSGPPASVPEMSHSSVIHLLLKRHDENEQQEVLHGHVMAAVRR